MSAQVWYEEKKLGARVGLTDNAMKDLRHSLKKNEVKKIDRDFCIHERAAKQLLQDLGCPQLDISGCANGAEPPGPIIIELTVHRLFNNPRLLLAHRDDTDELVRVKVPNNVNFQPRMKIKARPPLGGGDGPQLYTLEGRCPRFRGRW